MNNYKFFKVVNYEKFNYKYTICINKKLWLKKVYLFV
jgi:hypothetical protein